MRKKLKEIVAERLIGLEQRQAARESARREGKYFPATRPARPTTSQRRSVSAAEREARRAAEAEHLRTKVKRIQEKLLGQPVEATA